MSEINDQMLTRKGSAAHERSRHWDTGGCVPVVDDRPEAAALGWLVTARTRPGG